MKRLLGLGIAWSATLIATGPHDILSGIKVSAAVLGAYLIGASVHHLASDPDDDHYTGFWHRLGQWRQRRQRQALANKERPPAMDETERLMRSIPTQSLPIRCQQIKRLGEVGTSNAIEMLDEIASARFGHAMSRNSARKAALDIRLRAADEEALLVHWVTYPDMPSTERSRILEKLGDVGETKSLERLAHEQGDEVGHVTSRIRSRLEELSGQKGRLSLPDESRLGALSPAEDMPEPDA